MPCSTNEIRFKFIIDCFVHHNSFSLLLVAIASISAVLGLLVAVAITRLLSIVLLLWLAIGSVLRCCCWLATVSSSLVVAVACSGVLILLGGVVGCNGISFCYKADRLINVTDLEHPSHHLAGIEGSIRELEQSQLEWLEARIVRIEDQER